MEQFINNRIIGIMVHGKSIEELERRIEELKDFNICWCSVARFEMMNEFILSKINKKIEIAIDCAEINKYFRIDYEKKTRFPRFLNFLKDKKSKLLFTSSEIRDSLYSINKKEIFEKYKDKIYIIKNSRRIKTPNTLALFIMLLTKLGVKKIILFGCDGYEGDPKFAIDSYYKKETLKGLWECSSGSGLHSDTKSFNGEFKRLYTEYCKENELKEAKIINCSPNSFITIFEKISYNKLIEKLNGKIF